MRLAAAAATAFACSAIVLPSAAAAKTFCVSAPGCVGAAEPTISAALAAAQLEAGRDVVSIGPGTFTEAVSDAASNPVDIIGAGAGATTIAAPSPVSLIDPSSVLRDIAIRPAAGQGALTSAGAAQRVAVTLPPSLTGVEAVTLSDGGSLVDSSIDMSATTAAGTAVAASGTSAGTLVQGVSVAGSAATTAVSVLGTTTVDRLRATAVGRGVYVTGNLNARDALIRTAPGGLGVEVYDVFAASADAVLRARNLTVVGGGPGSIGIRTWYEVGASKHPDVTVRDSIVRGFDFDVLDQGGQVFVGSTDLAIESGSITHDAVNSPNVDVDPSFVDPAAGDYHLRAGSPLRDGGGATPPVLGETDLDGAARVVDGDGDGIPRRDLGAFEYQPPSAAPAPAAGQPPPGAAPATPNSARLILPAGLLRLRGGKIAVRLKCKGPAGSRCAGILELRRGNGRSARGIAAARFSMAAGRTSTVTMRPGAAAQRRITGRAGRARLTATLTAGTSTPAARTVKLVRRP